MLQLKIIFVWLILATFFISSFQVGGTNCLREYPGVLDADFSLLNRFEDKETFVKEDIAKHVALFTTRFKHGHFFSNTDNDALKFIGDGISIYKKTANNSFQVFLTLEVQQESINVTSAIQFYKTIEETVLKINSEFEGLVAGLYVDPKTETYEDDLYVLESVFGSKDNSSVPIGIGFNDCPNAFKTLNDFQIIQRLDFLACNILVPKKPTPEQSADLVIAGCDHVRKLAVVFNITAVIRCRVRYHTFGTTRQGIVGSVSDFKKFWCRIVEVVRDKSHLNIIMQSAFDETPSNYKANTVNMRNTQYHTGWWRRRETTSNEAIAFVEKVEELEGGSEPGNCTPLCGICASSEDCCADTECKLDFSFQPFENGLTPPACQSTHTTCAPRPPKTKPQMIVPSNKTATQENIPGTDDSVFNAAYLYVLIFGVVILCGTAAAYILYRRRKPYKILTDDELSIFFKDTPTSVQGDKPDNLPYDKDLEVTKHNFEICEDEVLGSGAFGVVVKGRLGNEQVAIKTTRPGVDRIYFKSLLTELKVLMYLGKHENIVNLLGAYTSQLTFGKLYVFLELCPMGSLLEFLRGHRDNFWNELDSNDLRVYENEKQLTSQRVLQWSIQIACAMKHLAEKRVIHADIAARNVLVFSWNQVKLTDFGLSRRLYEYVNYVKTNQEPLPWRHMSVEALRDMNFSLKSDVWSFGVTMWEMFSLGNVPYPGHNMSHDFVELLLTGLRLTCPQHAHPLIYEAMSSCWTINLKSRPQIALVHSKLVSALEELY